MYRKRTSSNERLSKRHIGDKKDDDEPIDKNSRFFGVRRVSGCGKDSGFQLVIDSQRMSSLFPKDHLAKGFKVNKSKNLPKGLK